MDTGTCGVPGEQGAGDLDASWVTRLARGAMLAWLGCALVAALTVGGILLPNLMDKPQAVLPRTWGVWPYVWVYLSAAIFIAGVWLLTTPHAGEDERSRDAWWRSSSRWCLPAVVIALAYLRSSGLGGPSQDMALWPIIAFIFGTWLAFVLIHVGRLARRAEARFLPRLATACLIALPVIWVLETAPLIMIYWWPPKAQVVITRPGQRSVSMEPVQGPLEKVESFCFAASQVVGLVLTGLMLVFLAGCGWRLKRASSQAVRTSSPTMLQPKGPDPPG